MNAENGPCRRLETPQRERSRSRRSEPGSRHRSRSRSHSRRIDEREEALKRERARVRKMEMELRRERDKQRRSEGESSGMRPSRSRQPGARSSRGRRSRSRQPGARSSREGRSRSRRSGARPSRDTRSRSRQPRASPSIERHIERRSERWHATTSVEHRGRHPRASAGFEHQSRQLRASAVERCGGLPGCCEEKDQATRSPKRSRSPTFSSKDVIQIIQSIKEALPPQPLNQGTVTNRSLDHKNMVPEFNPSEKSQRIDVWLRKVNECAKVYGWDERTVIHFATQKLTGLAKTWYESLNSILFTWEEWQSKLLSAFPVEQNYGQVLEDMLKRKTKPNELIEVYYYEKVSLLNQCDITGRRAVDCIIHGITDRTMRSSALALRCEEPDQLLKFLLSNNKEPSGQTMPFRDRNLSSSDGRQSNRANTKLNPNLFCYNCKEKGHPYSRCPKPLVKCSACDRVGHRSDDCRSKNDPSSNKAVNTAKTMCISNSNPSHKFIKQAIVNGNPVDAFIDLGSEVTLIKQSFVSQLGLTHDKVPTSMKGFGNSIVPSAGSVKLDITIDGVAAVVPCRIVDDSLLEKTILVGQTFSEQPHVIVYKDVNKLQFTSVGLELPDLIEEVSDLERIRIVGHCQIFGAASIKAATGNIFSGSVVFESRVVGRPNEQFVVWGGAYEVKQGVLFVTVTPLFVPCQLQQNFVFSRAEKVRKVYRLSSLNVPTIFHNDNDVNSTKQLDESQLRLGESVSDHDRVRLIELLRRYEDCFSHDLADLGCTNVTEMKIELNSQRPVVYRPYRLSYHEREKVRTMIDEMLKAGIIRESVSNYASPIILVRKKDGGVRLCVDYRLLNSVTVKERYPIPVIEDEIARLSGQAWFITLDLMSGYYQVPIAEESKHLTAFVTPDGQYEYNRMPFGLANAPAVFQRMMNHVLGPARFSKATVYIDDLLIFGKSASECLERFEEVLNLLKEANLKLNLAKCAFLQNTINYLGFEISSDGMRPGKTKVQSVIDFPCPENVHGARQFLGLVSYFRKFIQGFAQLAYPITKLLKKNAAWEWGDDQEESFKILKEKLTDRPVLAIYDPAAETELHTDASRVGVGGILLQRPVEGQGPLHPVAYYSRQTTPEERNFHSYELETLAVVCALKKLRVYLLGKPFKIVTDCSALRSTFEKRDLIPRIARWWLALQEYDCTVEYRSGTRMSHADALSRNPINDSDTLNPERYPTVMVINDDDWLLTLQLGDPELRRIRDILCSNLDPKGVEYIKDNYVLKDNRLFRCERGDQDCMRWVVPRGARWQVCKRNHDDIGHVGFEKTLDRIKRNYWFAKMKRFVKKYVGACIECAYAKKASTTREGFLHPIEKVDKPFHTLHIDHLGPFVKSKRGHTHILTVVDSFTKFLFIKPVRNTNTQNVIKVLQDIFDTFRAPDRLISDRGSCFTSHTFRRFCLDRGIKHILNAVASPRSNGQVERYNRTVLDSLTAQNFNDDEKDWDNKLGRIQWGLNNTVQKTIGRSPADVMFGTEMRSEFSPVLNELNDVSREDASLPSIRSEVKSRIDKAQTSQKKYYDKGRRPARTYNKGDLVKITKVAFQNNGKSTKLMPSYEGPFRVIKVIGNDRYKVAPIPGFEGMKNKRKTTVAADRMQPWIHLASLEIDNDPDSGASSDASDGNMSE